MTLPCLYKLQLGHAKKKFVRSASTGTQPFARTAREDFQEGPIVYLPLDLKDKVIDAIVLGHTRKETIDFFRMRWCQVSKAACYSPEASSLMRALLNLFGLDRAQPETQSFGNDLTPGIFETWGHLWVALSDAFDWKRTQPTKMGRFWTQQSWPYPGRGTYYANMLLDGNLNTNGVNNLTERMLVMIGYMIALWVKDLLNVELVDMVRGYDKPPGGYGYVASLELLEGPLGTLTTILSAFSALWWLVKAQLRHRGYVTDAADVLARYSALRQLDVGLRTAGFELTIITTSGPGQANYQQLLNDKILEIHQLLNLGADPTWDPQNHAIAQRNLFADDPLVEPEARFLTYMEDISNRGVVQPLLNKAFDVMNNELIPIPREYVDAASRNPMPHTATPWSNRRMFHLRPYFTPQTALGILAVGKRAYPNRWFVVLLNSIYESWDNRNAFDVQMDNDAVRQALSAVYPLSEIVNASYVVTPRNGPPFNSERCPPGYGVAWMGPTNA